MKKLFILFISIIVLGIVLLFVLPYTMHDKIDKLIKTEGNKMIKGHFDYSDLDISIFRNFPKVAVSIHNFWIKGEGTFANDTLLAIKEATVVVDLFSIFGDKGYDIKKIYVSDGSFKGIVLPDGSANWDIMKPEESTSQHEPTEEKAPFKMKLNSFLIKNFKVDYQNRLTNQYLTTDNFNLLCSGDFAAQKSLMNLQTKIKALTFKSDGIALLSNAMLNTDMFIEADFENKKFTFKKNSISLNAITTGLDGWIAMTDHGTDMDLKLNTNQVGFKEILSLIPAIYSNNFDGLQTDGVATIDAVIQGTMIGDSIVPAFNIALNVENAMFKYPSLPQGVDYINVQAVVQNPGGSFNQTRITINPFNFRWAGNPFSLIATIQNPVLDPHFDVVAKGTINLATIGQVIPMGDTNFSGLIQSDVTLSGNVSYIEKEEYDRIKASGKIDVNGMHVKMSNGMMVDIDKSTLQFTPQYLQLSKTTFKVGNSDATIESKFENYLGYIFKKGMLKGQLNVQSNYLNLDDFATSVTDEKLPTDEKQQVTRTAAPGMIEVPQNIDFVMNADLKEVIFNGMSLANVKGKLSVAEGKADMQNLSMNAMGGSIVMNGAYSTQQLNTPTLDAAFKLNSISFAQAYKDLHIVQQMVPIFENLKGDFSGNMQIAATLDSNMSPVLNSVQSNGSISTNNVTLSGIKAIDQIADAINKPDLKELSVKNLHLDYVIKDGRIATQPFDIKFGDFNINLSGTTGLDQTIDYTGIIKLPAKSTIGNLPVSTVGVKIGGTFQSPKVAIDTKSMMNEAANKVIEKAAQEIGSKLGLDSATTANIDSLKSNVKEKVIDKALDFLQKKLK